MKLIVTVPALNEEKTIAQVVRGVPRNIPGITQTEVIVLNDGSTDQTAGLATGAGALVINITGRPGLGSVFRTGLERAMRRGADIIVNIDGDMQFNPADIAKLVQPLLKDEADFVTCSRFSDPELMPTMPGVKYWGNKVVTRIINWICGGTNFSDVSCGFRAFNREAAYRMTLFGRFTYTQECFIDLFGKGLRIAEVPLKVRGVREHGKSRIASSIWKYATNSLPIILRAMRDIQPLKFFGGIGAAFFIPGLIAGLVVTTRYTLGHVRTEMVNGVKHTVRVHLTSPFTSLIPLSGAMIVVGFLMFALALLADMLGRHRRISEELLYLTRRRVYSNRRTVKASLPPLPEELHLEHAESPESMGPTLHDSWSLPIMRSVPTEPAKSPDPELARRD
jgi:glycosyltransferase involved in cell wall biosynthesis